MSLDEIISFIATIATILFLYAASKKVPDKLDPFWAYIGAAIISVIVALLSLPEN